MLSEQILNNGDHKMILTCKCGYAQSMITGSRQKNSFLFYKEGWRLRTRGDIAIHLCPQCTGIGRKKSAKV